MIAAGPYESHHIGLGGNFLMLDMELRKGFPSWEPGWAWCFPLGVNLKEDIKPAQVFRIEKKAGIATKRAHGEN